MGRFYSDREVKVIAALLGAIPDDADDLYLPVGEGVTGRPEHVTAIAIMRQDSLLPADAEAYVVEERPQWDRGGETITRVAFVRRPAASPASSSPTTGRTCTRHSPASTIPSSCGTCRTS